MNIFLGDLDFQGLTSGVLFGVNFLFLLLGFEHVSLSSFYVLPQRSHEKLLFQALLSKASATRHVHVVAG